MKEDEARIDDMRYEFAVNKNITERTNQLLSKKQRERGYKPSEYGMVAKGSSRKIDGVTFDDEGKLIPLSKRYDETKSDERYSIDIDSFANDDKTIKELKLLEEHVDQLLEISGGARKSVPKTRAFAAQLLKEYKSTCFDEIVRLRPR